jgi:hypothetical protein
LNFLDEGEWILKNSKLSALYDKRYKSTPQNLLNDASTRIKNITRLVGNKSIHARRLVHKVMFTNEKVRWVLLESVQNTEKFINWYQGNYHSFAFTPNELLQLAQDVDATLQYESHSDNLTKLLTRKEIGLNNDDMLQSLHLFLSEWALVSSEILLSRTHS